jgi:hypothetical protein
MCWLGALEKRDSPAAEDQRAPFLTDLAGISILYRSRSAGCSIVFLRDENLLLSGPNQTVTQIVYWPRCLKGRADMNTVTWLSKRGEIEQRVEAALGEINHNRALDSLEMIIVETVLTAHGIIVPEGSKPPVNTINGWLQWAERFSFAL